MQLKFTKMHGAGNDYVYVNCFQEQLPGPAPEIARLVADRHKGIGGDGLILICPSEVADARMEMYNADGSRAEMCGNGIRCVAKFVYDHKIKQSETLDIETDNGILKVQLETSNGIAHRVQVDLGEPILAGTKIPTTIDSSQVVNQVLSAGGREFEFTAVSMGNPHCVIFVDQLSDELVHTFGPLIENHQLFPNRVNVEFVQVHHRNEVTQRTWERGSGETLACGTGAGAVCVAGVLTGRTDRTILNHLLGGDLELVWQESDNHVYKTGPAAEVFSGIWTGKN